MFISAAFMGLMGISTLIQVISSTRLRNQLSSNYPRIGWLPAVLGILVAIYILSSVFTIGSPASIANYVFYSAFLASFFVITWQLWSVVFTDASEGWKGFFAGILNGFAFPALAIGHAISPIVVYLAYIALIGGQVFSALYWWSPLANTRAYARSTDKGKFAFGLTGFLTSLVGAVAVFVGPLQSTGDVQVWIPWSVYTETGYVTDPTLVWGFCASLLFWVMLGPRLGKKEIKATVVSEDIVTGGKKYIMAFFAALGLIGVYLAPTLGFEIEMAGFAIQGFNLFIIWAPAAVLFMMGAIYAGRTDVVTGLPLVLAAIFILVHPVVLANFVIIAYIILIVTQALLMIETKVRGLTYFQQGTLSVIATLASSAMFVMIILGVLGSGPPALWPTNFWFNVELFAGIPLAVQAPVILVLPMLALLVRNVAIVGYAHGRGISGGDVLSGLSMLFALLIPIVAQAFKGITHMALTAAAIMLALYAISFALVLSVNLSLAENVEDTGNPIEGMLIRLTTIAGIVFGALIAVYVLATFSGFPSALQVSGAITWLVILVTGLEILNFIGWLSAGARLGMLRSGFKFMKHEDLVKEASLARSGYEE
ncbi:hypothetical protein EU537_12730 [Candidatus Thorarchaeota archaeon]|nr:MAG: hypothetical protein EU537_12730 [Candidatus Thorarchaeota archaeon]